MAVERIILLFIIFQLPKIMVKDLLRVKEHIEVTRVSIEAQIDCFVHGTHAACPSCRTIRDSDFEELSRQKALRFHRERSLSL